MKVAYNACFGGFGLSPKAMTEFAKRKGINLTWYKQTGYKHEGKEEYQRFNGVPAKGYYHSITKDAGEVIKSLPRDCYYYPDMDSDGARTDLDLIAVIEEMGDDASGQCAKLAIKEIPDGRDFEITEYDGFEDVVPPRSSW